MTPPFFSIVIPTRGRPQLLRDTLQSAIWQDFDDFEVVASDNYNDSQTQAVLDEFKAESRLRCFRTERLLNMPEHWDFATQHARGRYVMILTDRSVLKQGALRTIHESILSSDSPVEACSWRWSLYDDTEGSEYGDGYMFKDKKTFNFSTKRLAEEFANGLGGYVYCLPRGLNGCYKNTLMERIRGEFGSPFKPISPDYYSAFAIMGLAKEVLYIDKTLFISQGNTDSQGRKSMSGIDTGYIKALGEHDLYSHVPIKAFLVKNLIFEDFLVAREEIGGNLKDVTVNWPTYFENCYYELLIKKDVGVLSSEVMKGLFAEWERALSTFDESTQKAAKENAERLKESFNPRPDFKRAQKNPSSSSSLTRVTSWIKRLISALRSEEGVSNNMMSGKKKWQSALEIAGFSFHKGHV